MDYYTYCKKFIRTRRKSLGEELPPQPKVAAIASTNELIADEEKEQEQPVVSQVDTLTNSVTNVGSPGSDADLGDRRVVMFGKVPPGGIKATVRDRDPVIPVSRGKQKRSSTAAAARKPPVTALKKKKNKKKQNTSKKAALARLTRRYPALTKL
jgi:hypothetical protein